MTETENGSGVSDGAAEANADGPGVREDDVVDGAGSQGVGRRLVTSVEDHAWAPCQLDNDALNTSTFPYVYILSGQVWI